MVAFATSQCEIYKSLFKPKVAQAAVECLKAGMGALCPVYKCADDALKAACPDATASTVCAAMQTTCTNAGMAIAAGECEQYAQGLNAAGRTQLQACDCKFGFYSCIEGL